MKIYLVGGSVRDALLVIKSKDLDYVVETDFEGMRSLVLDKGFEIVHEKPEFLTMRVKLPNKSVQDFACCRTEGNYDGRRPGSTAPTTLEEDLSRRDFTVNAMAVPVNDQMEPQWDQLIDLHGGRADLDARILRFVGDPEERIQEDGLRWLRAIRFQITKELIPHPFGETFKAIYMRTSDPLGGVSVERVREELLRCFRHDTLTTLEVLQELPPYWLRDGLWLTPTLEPR